MGVKVEPGAKDLDDGCDAGLEAEKYPQHLETQNPDTGRTFPGIACPTYPSMEASFFEDHKCSVNILIPIKIRMIPPKSSALLPAILPITGPIFVPRRVIKKATTPMIMEGYRIFC